MKREKYYWKKLSELIGYYNELDCDDPARKRLMKCIEDIYDLWLDEVFKNKEEND